MVRRCFKCIFGILIVLTIVYLYLVIHVTRNNNVTEDFNNFPVEKRHQRSYFSNTLENEKTTDSYTKNKKCELIHVAMICAGYNSSVAFVTVIKSILFYRTKPLHFHLVVDEISYRSLSVLMRTWKLPNVIISFYKAELWIPKVSWIPNKHYSGVYGLLKLILPEAIQEIKVLVFDTDVTVLKDIDELWKIFQDFEDEHLLGLVENQSDWYKKLLPNGQRSWPALERGFNTGVILMHLQRLRSSDFRRKWVETAKTVLQDVGETTLADQDIINAVIKDNPKIIFRVKCAWNIQLSDHTLSESCYGDRGEINIIHWNSPRKLSVKNKNIEDFRKMYTVFLELDGNLLRKKLFNCHDNHTILPLIDHSPCSKFNQGASISYRTHYFYLEYVYNIFSKFDVTLVTQCSADRLSLLEEMSKHWPGSISVALYLNDIEAQNFVLFVERSDELRTRKNIAYHVVYKEGEFYPINYLRNVAMEYLSAGFIFHLDIDFLPQLGLYKLLMDYVARLNPDGAENVALVVPAFETQRYRYAFPKSKAELLKLLNRGAMYTFRYHVWSQGHAPTNYSFWKNAVEPYEISWEPDFEPYIVVPKSIPRFDTRFIGFGWNKVSHVTHLTALGYRYLVLPDAFVIHRPHAPSSDIAKFRVDVAYRRCLRKLKDKFVKELLLQYGQEFAIKLNKFAKEKRVNDTKS